MAHVFSSGIPSSGPDFGQKLADFMRFGSQYSIKYFRANDEIFRQSAILVKNSDIPEYRLYQILITTYKGLLWNINLGFWLKIEEILPKFHFYWILASIFVKKSILIEYFKFGDFRPGPRPWPRSARPDSVITLTVLIKSLSKIRS